MMSHCVVPIATVTHSGFGSNSVEHVARVVVEPLGFRIVGLWRERDRASDLEDHLRHGLFQKT